MYAHVEGDTITAVAAHLPNAARIVGSRAWVHGLPSAPASTQEACGWFAVADTARPPDSATTTHGRTVKVVDGRPVVVWVSRPWTAGELADLNAATIRTQLDAAIAANRDFLAVGSPTAAQTVTQTRAMARQLNGLLRLTLGALDGTD